VKYVGKWKKCKKRLKKYKRYWKTKMMKISKITEYIINFVLIGIGVLFITVSFVKDFYKSRKIKKKWN